MKIKVTDLIRQKRFFCIVKICTEGRGEESEDFWLKIVVWVEEMWERNEESLENGRNLYCFKVYFSWKNYDLWDKRGNLFVSLRRQFDGFVTYGNQWK